jgi:putative AlgH/UPF0301 family transcriptional regulator
MESGKLLIAEPSIFGDQNFHRSIVIMVEKKIRVFWVLSSTSP